MFAALPQKGRDSGEQAAFHRASTNTETHTNQITPKQHYNACESSLFTHTFTIESLRCIWNKIRYIVPQSTDVLSFLHHSAIWIWWGSAPCAPNVETPLLMCEWCVKSGVTNIRPAGWIRPTRGSSSARRITLLSVKITERHKLHFYRNLILLVWPTWDQRGQYVAP